MAPEKGLRINERIRATKVRLIDHENNQVGVIEKYLAMNMAREAGLDLVEVAPTSEPPVCRIMDYGKYLYQQKRKVRESHKKHAVHLTTLKEIRLRPETDLHDLQIKVDHARKFIEKGHKVQFTLLFRGRQMLHQERGNEMLKSISSMMEDVAKIEQQGRLMNRRMTLTVVPKQ
ncbi:MAG: translation initiation factor IF-3 [Phycisphaerae bacterium]